MNIDFLIPLKELSLKAGADYPGIETAEPWEQVYAIRCALEGTEAANQDLHKLIDCLRRKLNLTTEQIVEIWETECKEPNPLLSTGNGSLPRTEQNPS